MITTEEGLTFRRDGTGWACIEIPPLRMHRGGRYSVFGQRERFPTAAVAMEAYRRPTREVAPSAPRSVLPRRPSILLHFPPRRRRVTCSPIGP